MSRRVTNIGGITINSGSSMIGSISGDAHKTCHIGAGTKVGKLSMGPVGRKRIARIKTDCGRITIYDNDSLRIKNYIGPSGGNIDPTNCSDTDFFCRYLVSRGITIISVKHF